MAELLDGIEPMLAAGKAGRRARVPVPTVAKDVRGGADTPARRPGAPGRPAVVSSACSRYFTAEDTRPKP